MAKKPTRKQIVEASRKCINSYLKAIDKEPFDLPNWYGKYNQCFFCKLMGVNGRANASNEICRICPLSFGKKNRAEVMVQDGTYCWTEIAEAAGHYVNERFRDELFAARMYELIDKLEEYL